jgi:hypothetical protein
MKWQFIFTWGWWRPKRRSATQSREEVGDVNNQDELLKRRVAETIKRVEADIPEPLAHTSPIAARRQSHWGRNGSRAN